MSTCWRKTNAASKTFAAATVLRLALLCMLRSSPTVRHRARFFLPPTPAPACTLDVAVTPTPPALHLQVSCFFFICCGLLRTKGPLQSTGAVSHCASSRAITQGHCSWDLSSLAAKDHSFLEAAPSLRGPRNTATHHCSLWHFSCHALMFPLCEARCVNTRDASERSGYK